MADIQSNIQVNIQTQNALDNLKALQAQLSAFHTSMARASATTAAQASGMQQNLINSINSTGKFNASFATVATTTQQFTTALEKNKLSLREYFRYSVAASKSFGQSFKTEFDTVNRVAVERVKDLQAQYIKLGTDANGAIQTIKIRPLTLDMNDLSTKTQIAAQRQQVLNKLLEQGSTNLLNFGKNTQWAGRQLMVGFTLPLGTFAGAAIKAYSDLQQQIVMFKRVYGDFSTSTAETDKMAKQVQGLAQQFTQYGLAVKDTLDMAANAAAAGKTGNDLLTTVSQSARLAALGGISQQKALDTTITLTNAFNISAKDLGGTMDYLNAVQNQTVLNLNDITTAIPKAAPVVKQLGGNVQDLAFFLTAMKQGGVNASEGANALKSGLSAIINPTKAATTMLQGFGINITDIVNKDKGNLRKTVMDLAGALDTLDPLNRAKAIETMFGKFQFARISALFQNINDPNSQAATVNKISQQTPGQLHMLAQKELQQTSSSPLYQFQKSMQDFQVAIAPIGETFLKVITPIMNGINGILNAFNGLPDGIKQGIVTFTALVAGLGPVVLMTFGLVANGVANVIKGFAKLKNFFNNVTTATDILGEQTSYMTQEQINAAAAASSLDQVHQTLKQTFTTEAMAVEELTQAYKRSIAAQEAMGGMSIASKAVKAYATGGLISGPGTGTSDSILARVSNGEAIIPAKSVAKNPQLISQLVSGNIPGFETGGIRGSVRMFPGGSELSHFNGASVMTGSEIMQMANEQASKMNKEESEAYLKTWESKLEKQAEKLGITFEKVLDEEFKVYNNKVVTMSSALNNLLKPSSGGVRAEVVQQEFAASGKEAHSFARLQLEKMGVAPKEISKIIDQLANATNAELGKFGKDTLITEEHLSNALDAAYQTVAKSSANLQSALEKMSTVTYFDSKATGTKGSGGTRIKGGVVPGGIGYRGTGALAAQAATRDLGPNQEPYFSQVSRIYYQNDLHKNIHDTLAKEDPATLRRIGRLKDKEAKLLELEAVAIQKEIVTEEQLTSAKQIQVSTQSRKNSNKSLEIVGQALAENAESSIATGAEKNLDIHSPSRRLMKIGENAGEGIVAGLSDLIPKTKKAGEAFGLQFAKQVTVISPAMRQYLNEWGGKIVAPYLKNIKQASLLSVKILTEEEKVSRKAIIAEKERLAAIEQNTIAEQTNVVATQESTLAKEADAMASGTKGGILGKINMGGKLGGAAMMASMILPMLGSVPGMGGIANDPTVNGILGTVSSLGMMGQFAPGSMGKIGGKVLGASAKLGSILPGTAGKYFGGVAGGLAGDIGAGASAAEATGLGVGAAAAEGGLGAIAVAAAPVALALGGVALAAWGAYAIYQKIQDDQKKLHESIYGLSDAMKTTTAETKSLGEAFGFTPTTSLSQRLSAGVNSTSGDLQSQNFSAQLVNDYKNNKDNSIIAKNYEPLINTLKNTATTGEASNVLKTKELAWIASGMDKRDAQSLADAIKTLAGKIDANTKVVDKKGNVVAGGFIKTSTANAAENIVNLFNNGQAKNVTPGTATGGHIAKNKFVTRPTDELKKARSELIQQTSSDLQSLSGLFSSGAIKAKEFNNSMNSIEKTFKNLSKTNNKEAIGLLRSTLTTLGIPVNAASAISAIKDTNTQLKVLSYITRTGDLPTAIKYINLLTTGFAAGNAGNAAEIKKILDLVNAAAKDPVIPDTRTAQQKALDAISAKQTLYSNAQSLLQMKEDKINTAYSERIKALDSIQKINQQIVQSQKDQLGLATALSQGDIAAAAAAAQQMRANNASSSFQNQQQALQDQQANAIANATVKIGKKTYTGSQLTDIINGLQVKAIVTQNPKLKGNFATGGHINGPGSGTSDSIPAMLSNGEYVVKADSVKKLGVPFLDKLNSGRVGFAKGGLATPNNPDVEELKKEAQKASDSHPWYDMFGWFTDSEKYKAIGKWHLALGDKLIYTDKQNRWIDKNGFVLERDPNNPFSRAFSHNLFGNVRKRNPKDFKNHANADGSYNWFGYAKGGLVPKYFAKGGRAMGTDIVPAMLTPGEFVVNVPAVKKFGADKLRSINSGSNPESETSIHGGDSVYNYSISVNVSSQSNPDDIANIVLREIRRIDSQQIRSGRF